MTKKYTPEEIQKLFEQLPEDLKKAALGFGTTQHIWDISERYELEDVSEVSKLVGSVLFGILAPEDFQEELEKSLQIDSEVARKVTQEVNRFIFYPVRPLLEQLHEIKVTPEQKPKAKPVIAGGIEEIQETVEIERPKEPEKPSTPSSQDTYRESIE